MPLPDPWQPRLATTQKTCAGCGATIEPGEGYLLNVESGRILCPLSGHKQAYIVTRKTIIAEIVRLYSETGISAEEALKKIAEVMG